MKHTKNLTKIINGAGIGIASFGTMSICTPPYSGSMAKLYKGIGEYFAGFGLLCLGDYIERREGRVE